MEKTQDYPIGNTDDAECFGWGGQPLKASEGKSHTGTSGLLNGKAKTPWPNGKQTTHNKLTEEPYSLWSDPSRCSAFKPVNQDVDCFDQMFEDDGRCDTMKEAATPNPEYWSNLGGWNNEGGCQVFEGSFPSSYTLEDTTMLKSNAIVSPAHKTTSVDNSRPVNLFGNLFPNLPNVSSSTNAPSINGFHHHTTNPMDVRNTNHTADRASLYAERMTMKPIAENYLYQQQQHHQYQLNASAGSFKPRHAPPGAPVQPVSRSMATDLASVPPHLRQQYLDMFYAMEMLKLAPPHPTESSSSLAKQYPMAGIGGGVGGGGGGGMRLVVPTAESYPTFNPYVYGRVQPVYVRPSEMVYDLPPQLLGLPPPCMPFMRNFR